MKVQKRFYVGGSWVDPFSGETTRVVSPATEEVVGEAPIAGAADVDRAVAAARKAFDEGPWPRMDVGARVEVLRRARVLLAQAGQDIANLVTLELGLPIAGSLRQVMRPLTYLDDAADCAAKICAPEVRRDSSGVGLVLREPVGVVGAIVPWNGPFLMALSKLAPALAAGCTVVLKPAPETPLDCDFLAEAFHEAGLPAGVLNIVPGAAAAGNRLMRHPDVDFVSFTGSSAVGRLIGAACGENFKRVCLELGGKSAAIVLPDADLEKATQTLSTAIFANAGQACIALSRVLAPRERYGEVVDMMRARAQSHVPGDPFDARTTMGPLISAKHRERVEGYIAFGRMEGARLVSGGGRPKDLARGWFLEPTVFADVDNGMRIAQEEIFGPVLSIIPYDTEEEAVQLANESIYGLGGAVFTADERHGLEIARRVRTGTFAINAFGHTLSVPFGGVKASGIGREHGPEAVEECLIYKSITIPESLAGEYERASPPGR